VRADFSSITIVADTMKIIRLEFYNHFYLQTRSKGKEGHLEIDSERIYYS
jgi:hypothetical protein